MNLWVLIGIAVMVGGFVLRFNPLLVVAAAGLATGLAAGLDPRAVLAAFGKAFNETRYVSVVWIVLPVIGLMERHGLQERARALIEGLRGATFARILTGYLLLRQLTAALGLISIAGQAQTVRPLLAPMAEAAARPRDEDEAEQVKALAAATDNIGVFFGEDIFLAIGSILLMKGFLEQQGIMLSPFELSVWAIPTAVAAFAIHAFRLARFERSRR
ncbi:MAG: DUF969 domain-containing protein [Sphingomonadaceae bacterium]